MGEPITFDEADWRELTGQKKFRIHINGLHSNAAFGTGFRTLPLLPS